MLLRFSLHIGLACRCTCGVISYARRFKQYKYAHRLIVQQSHAQDIKCMHTIININMHHAIINIGVSYSLAHHHYHTVFAVKLSDLQRFLLL